MRCDECLLLLDEYVRGELEGPAAFSVSAHLTACETCAGERASLAREQRLYARCVVSAPPTLWASVARRIEEEEAPRPRARTRAAGPRAWLEWVFGGRPPRTRMAFAAAVALVVVTSWVLVQTVRRGTIVQNQGVAAVNGGAPLADAPHTDGALTSNQSRQDLPQETQGLVAGRVKSRSDVVVSKPSPGAAVVRRASRKSLPLEAHRDAAAATLVAFEPDSDEANTRPRAAVAEVIYDETARHFERAQMLLRSFKNGRPSEGESGFDLVYERRFSRALLGRNILLRREAQSDGDEATAKLLDQLEPFLLDIANLDERAAPAQVRSIRERVQREGIVARLRLF